MNRLKTSDYHDRNPYRRRVDTSDRLNFLEATNNHSRLPRRTILSYGLELIDAECVEQTRKEVKDALSELFGPFRPTNHGHLITN